MDEQAQRRRRRIAALAVVAPIAAGLVIAAGAHFIGGEEGEVTTQSTAARPARQLVEGAGPAAAGSDAPRVRLAEGGSGKGFDSGTLGGEPYAVVFISTRCGALGGFLERVAADLEPGEGAVLAISADPKVDSPGAVRAYLSHNHINPGSSVHYLLGDEGELRGYWNAWGFAGPVAECPESAPAHLVSGAGQNTGVLDVGPTSPASLLTTPLRGMAK